MLIIFSGLPGAGKSTLARRLAAEAGAVWLRIDTIEYAIADGDEAVEVGAAGYRVAYAVAEDNLRLGRNVIGDSVNALEISRRAWRNVAERAGVRAVDIEVVCSNAAEHRRRVETRSVLTPCTWQEVIRRPYEPWTGGRIRIDTAGQDIEQSVATLRAALPMGLFAGRAGAA
jgi:predicted kinase